VDLAVGEYALIYAWCGQKEELDRLQSEVGDRPLRGLGGARFAVAMEGREIMAFTPELSRRCGLYALDAVMGAMQSRRMSSEAINTVRTTAQGANLVQLRDYAERQGVALRAAWRKPGAGMLVPAIFQWSLEHFSAVLAIEDARVRVYDRAFDLQRGRDRWLDRAALDEGSTGAFLIPASTALPDGWRWMEDSEASSVWGKGSALTTTTPSRAPP
jgi:ABC-type bacteriocin/lantibiotic exporter with double-glycine peptidase domain